MTFVSRNPLIRLVMPVALMLILALAACAKPQEPRPPWKTIDAATLKSMMASGKVSVFNTMSEIECLDHRIPGTKCLSCEEIENSPAGLPADKDQALVVYCESEGCYRSCRAADAAIRYGYKNVYILAGGMPAWKQAGYSLESVERIPRMPVASVKAPDLKEMLASRKDILLVDIRSETSFKEGHIEGAVNIPLYQITRRYDEIPLDRTVVLIDDRGFRTFLAGSYLDRKGFRVIRLFAGMRGWEQMLEKKS